MIFFTSDTHYWHKRIVRSGPNTLLPYRENPPDRAIGTDDIRGITTTALAGIASADIDISPLGDEDLWLVQARQPGLAEDPPPGPISLKDVAELQLVMPSRPNATRIASPRKRCGSPRC